jgi:putative methanogenesis marker protein 8
MSGLVKTSPIPAVIERITAAGGIVVDPDHASMDPVLGIAAAHAKGYSRILVTVATPQAAEDVRKKDPRALIIVVHVTGMSVSDAERVAAVSDIATGCASAAIRDVCGPKSLVQAGTSVPVFVLTPRGKELLVARIARIPHPLLISHARLPQQGDKTPCPLL